ncbi:hypothetical protein M3Y94_00051100 [Aphelenchoides besseyi]|nr:hypothetical protein M3Y94_00051100 [Aphelenchoides besseyi]
MIEITKQEPLPIAPIASYLLLKRRLARATSLEEIGRLQRLLVAMEKDQNRVRKMATKMVKRLIRTSKREVQRKIINSPLHEITAVDCHHDVITAFVRECPQFAGSPFVDQFTVPLVNLCEFGINSKKLTLRMKEHCN